jgi:hypothetical protein
MSCVVKSREADFNAWAARWATTADPEDTTTTESDAPVPVLTAAGPRCFLYGLLRNGTDWK